MPDESDPPNAFGGVPGKGHAQRDAVRMHLYGWRGMDHIGAFDRTAADNSAQLINYLKSAQPNNRMRLTLGRQRIFKGVTNDRVDGLKLSTGLGSWFSATAFGGLPAFSANGNGDLIYGARIATHPLSLYEIGLSYENISDSTQDLEENAGADITFRLGSHLTVSGVSSYNVDGRGWREHSYSALLKFNDLHIKPSYRYFQMDEHFESNRVENHLFGFLSKNEEIVNIAGTDVLWRGFSALQVGARARQYDYALRGEKAFYYAGLLNLKTNGGSRMDFEIGRMQGDTPENIYSLFRCNFYWRTPFDLSGSFFSADALYLDYDEPIQGQDGALHASINGGLLFMNDQFEIKLSGIYSRDPYFHDDLGALITFLHRF